MINENTITGTLPPSIDNFLMDMSQMYIDDLSYNDIGKFGERATEEDIKQLRKYKRELSQGFEEDDPEVKEIFNKIRNIIKGLDESINLKEELSLSELVKDSINHLVNDLGRDSNAEDFADDVINDIENNYDIDVDFSDPLKYKNWASEVACEVSRQLNNSINEATNQQTVYRVEYYDPKLYKWIKFYETRDIEDAKKELKTPIFGDPEKRIAQYTKSGVRKIKYDFVKKIDEALNGKEEIDEFFKLCNEIGLKTFGDLEKFADDNKNRIIVNKLLSKYDSSMSADAFFETLRDYKKEHLDSDEDFEYDDPLNVMKKLKRTDESMENKLNKQEVLDWISEHELAWEDFRNYFVDIYLKSEDVPMDEILGWIGEHDELAEDFEARFNAGIFTDADDYDDDMGMFDKSEYGLEEGLFDKKEFAVYDKNKGDKIIAKFKTREEAIAKAKELGGLDKGFHADNIKAYKDWQKQLSDNKKKESNNWGLVDGQYGRVVYSGFKSKEEADDFWKKQSSSQQMRLQVRKLDESMLSCMDKTSHLFDYLDSIDD